jgi:hypothetical protein
LIETKRQFPATPFIPSQIGKSELDEGLDWPSGVIDSDDSAQ